MGPHVKCLLFLILLEFELSQQIFEKYSNIKSHENPSSGSQVTCGWTDMTKLIFVFRNFANAPENNTELFDGGYILRM
jgi:hypothetical protein